MLSLAWLYRLSTSESPRRNMSVTKWSATPPALSRYVCFGAVVSHETRGFGSETEQHLDGRTRLTAGPEFQYLAEKDERCNRGRGLEIDTDLAARIPERRGKYLRESRSHETVTVGDSHAESNQREHVQAAVEDGLRAAYEKWPAAPEHDRGRQNQFGSCPEQRGSYFCERISWLPPAAALVV
jgi:hypothetical protein